MLRIKYKLVTIKGLTSNIIDMITLGCLLQTACHIGEACLGHGSESSEVSVAGNECSLGSI